MSVIANYGSDFLKASNKRGELKFDNQGYCEIVIGAFNCFNEHGQFYALTDFVKGLFAPGGALHRRINKRQLRGEFGHPVPEVGESPHNFLARLKRVTEKNVSHHFKRIRLEEGKDDKGNSVILVIALLKPTGHFGPALDTILKNPEENASFSIRSTSKRYNIDNVLTKHITAIFTWDYVNEPGIAVATKYSTPSLESLENPAFGLEDASVFSLYEGQFTESDLAKAEAAADYLASQTGIEDEDTESFTMIRDGNNWSKVELTSLRSPLDWVGR